MLLLLVLNGSFYAAFKALIVKVLYPFEAKLKLET